MKPGSASEWRPRLRATRRICRRLSYARTRQQGKPLSRGRESVEEAPVIAHPDVAENAAGPEELCRGRPGARPVLQPPCRRNNHCLNGCRARRRRTSARGVDPDREELALAVVRRGQQSGHPGTRRIRLHPATTTSNSSTGTIGSIPFTRAHTEFMASIFSVARCSWAAAAACTCCSTEPGAR